MPSRALLAARRMLPRHWLLAAAAMIGPLSAACGSSTGGASPRDSGPEVSASRDGARPDARPHDAAPHDGRSIDGTLRDGASRDGASRDATLADDGPSTDAGVLDGSSGDVQRVDGGGVDGRSIDGTLRDGGSRDATLVDARPRDGAPQDSRPLDAADVVDSGVDAAPGTSISISPLTLQPPFSTTIYDYYVRCAAGANPLTVSMTAAPGYTIGLLQPTATAPSTSSSTAVTVTENEAIVAGVTSVFGTTESYWIRCLPHDFPEFQLTPHPEAGTPTPGYYLVGNAQNLAAGTTGYAMAFDINGVPVWYGQTQNIAPVVDVDSLLPGTISYVPLFSYTLEDTSVQYELHDLTAGTTTYVEPSGIPLNPHELQVLTNGDFVMFASPIVYDVDLTGLASFGAHENMANCVIQEVDSTGAMVWQWTATDHFDPLKDSTFPEPEQLQNGGTIVNVFHCNSLDVAPDGDLLVSARDMDSVFMVSKATGAVLWKMGGATYTVEGAPYITVEGDPGFFRQHDVRLLPNGNVSMYDDHTEMAPPGARALILAPDVDAGTATVEWQHSRGPGTVFAMGSFRVSSDGTAVIGWGNTPSCGFSEVDVNGNDMLDFTFPDHSETYRAIKIPTSAFDINVFRATTGAN